MHEGSTPCKPLTFLLVKRFLPVTLNYPDIRTYFSAKRMHFQSKTHLSLWILELQFFRKLQRFLTEDWKRCCHWCRLQLRLSKRTIITEPKINTFKKSVKSTECSSVYWQVRTIIEIKKVRRGLQLICLIYGFWCFSLENVTVLPASSYYEAVENIDAIQFINLLLFPFANYVIIRVELFGPF